MIKIRTIKINLNVLSFSHNVKNKSSNVCHSRSREVKCPIYFLYIARFSRFLTKFVHSYKTDILIFWSRVAEYLVLSRNFCGKDFFWLNNPIEAKIVSLKIKISGLFIWVISFLIKNKFSDLIVFAFPIFPTSHSRAQGMLE